MVGDDAGRYPNELERDAPLRGGGSVRLRPIRPDDLGRLKAFHGRLSRDSLFYRFFSPMPYLSDERAAHFTTVDYDRRLALVAIEPPVEPAEPQAAPASNVGLETADSGDERIVGVARYDRTGDDEAELALIVEDRLQHRGIGSALFWALVAVARARGVKRLTAEVLAENRRMLDLLRESGLPMQARRAGTAIHVALDLEQGPEADHRPAASHE